MEFDTWRLHCRTLPTTMWFLPCTPPTRLQGRPRFGCLLDLPSRIRGDRQDHPNTTWHSAWCVRATALPRQPDADLIDWSRQMVRRSVDHGPTANARPTNEPPQSILHQWAQSGLEAARSQPPPQDAIQRSKMARPSRPMTNRTQFHWPSTGHGLVSGCTTTRACPTCQARRQTRVRTAWGPCLRSVRNLDSRTATTPVDQSCECPNTSGGCLRLRARFEVLRFPAR